MNGAAARVEGDFPHLRALDQADRLPGSWVNTMARAIVAVRAACSSSDLATLSQFDLLSSEPQVRDYDRLSAIITAPPRSREKYPVATALLVRGGLADVNHGIDLLVGLLCELALDSSTRVEKTRISRFSQILRAAMEQAQSNDLPLLLGDASSLAETQARLNKALSRPVGLRPDLARLWTSWICPRLEAWYVSSAESVLGTMEGEHLLPSDDAREARVQTGRVDEPDDGVDAAVTHTEPIRHWSGHVRVANLFRFAQADLLHRQSDGDLCSDPDQQIPGPLVRKISRHAVKCASEHLDSGRYGEAMPHLALALLIAAGLRQMDLASVRWSESGIHPLELATSRPVLKRRVYMPPNAVQPASRPDIGWLEGTTNTLEWPVPSQLHKLLLLFRERFSPKAEFVFPNTGRGGSETLGLLNLVRQSGSRVTPGQLRLVLGSSIARELGPEVAQLAMADSYSMSVAPAYYSSPTIGRIWSHVAKLHATWFGENDAPVPTNHAERIGSRLQVTADCAGEWPASLAAERKKACLRKGAFEKEWVCRRNQLAARLVAVTGHRPFDSIGELNLYDVVPEYALIVLFDKRTDILRTTRLAVTGYRWVQALQDYLRFLLARQDSDSSPESNAAVAEILQGKLPLFTVVREGAVEKLTASELVATMPEVLREHPNWYRHRLNRLLQDRDIDPELRLAQLGWVVNAAGAWSEIAPCAARDVARELSPVLDAIMVDDGWFGKSQRVSPWSWDGLPLPSVPDWQARRELHIGEAKAALSQVRQGLLERGKELEADVLPRLADAIQEFCVALRLDVKRRRLVRADGHAVTGHHDITPEQCALMIGRIRQSDLKPTDELETVVARIWLWRLLLRSHREGLTAGCLPSRPVWGPTAKISPYLRGVGLAVRHANLVRQQVESGLDGPVARGHGVSTTLALLLWSPYHNLSEVQAAVRAAPTVARSAQRAACVRVSAIVDQRNLSMVFGGLPAILLAQRSIHAPKGRVPSEPKLCDWLRRTLPESVAEDFAENSLTPLLETLRVAASVEWSGPERLISSGEVMLSTVPLERCIANDDSWPARTMADCNTIKATNARNTRLDVRGVRPVASKREWGLSVGGYEDLLRLLNPNLHENKDGQRGGSRRGWRQHSQRNIAALLTTMDADATLGLITAYALHLVKYGGTATGKLEQRSVQTYITRFGRGLLELAGDRKLIDETSEACQRIYLAVVLAKPERSRRLALDAIQAFHKYMERFHEAAQLSFVELQDLVGVRSRATDPGLLTNPEVRVVQDVLQKAWQEEQSRSDVSPARLRLASLRLIYFALLEAAGVRPASVYGLVLGDLLFFHEEDDYLHLHTTGGYGVVKTTTSAGFVPLQGQLWSELREFVRDWVAKEKAAAPDVRSWNRLPLFSRKLGSTLRFPQADISGFVSDLLKWAANDLKAKPYWLRKRKILTLHDAVQRKPESPPRAREVHDALTRTGHATIQTPMMHYIADPAAPMGHAIREGIHVKRAAILRATQIPGSVLDPAWQRSGGAAGATRLALVLTRLGLLETAAPRQEHTTPPTPRSQGDLLPWDVALYARARQRDSSELEAASAAGLSPLQSEHAEAAAFSLLSRRGRVPWATAIDVSKRNATIPVPRRTAGTEGIAELMRERPTNELLSLSRVWVRRAGMSRLKLPDRCILCDASERAAATQAVARIALPGVRVIDNDSRVPSRYCMVVEEADSGKYGGSWPTMEWLLAVIWIWHEITSS